MPGNTQDVDYGLLFMSLPSPHIIIRADEDFTVVDQNDAHARVSFTKQADVIGKPMLEAFPDTSEKFLKTGISDLEESFRRVVRTSKPDSMPAIKYDLRGPDGEFVERWWRATHFPLFDKKQPSKVAAIYQVTEDITKEMKAKEQLDMARSQLDSALAIGLVSSWTWDMRKDLVFGDRNLAKNFGISYDLMSDGLPLQAFIDAIFDEDRKRVAGEIRKTIQNGGDYESEYRVISLDGTLRWVVARGKLEKDGNGEPIYFLGILIDITARKQAEAEAIESKHMFDALFNSTAAAIVVADMSGHVLSANKTFSRLFGYTTKDIRGGKLDTKQISAPGHDKVNRAIYEALRTTGEIEPTEKRYVRKDGSQFPAIVGGAMLPGESDRFVAFILDVSENERLKRINQIKDDFIALASHQLRTPASSVKQYLGVVLEGYAGEISDAQQRYLKTAEQANDRQLQIINDLLKTAQIDTGSYNLKLHAQDLSALIRTVIDQYAPMTDAKDQRISFSTKPVKARIDAHEIGICLANLIENASKYSPDGSTIKITCKQDGDMGVVQVTDTGVGIAKADQAKIFEKFTRIDNELSDTVSGNGLGLYWVKQIVELHKGSLSVESAVGKGTTFIVRLPL